MSNHDPLTLRALLDRVPRLLASGDWAGDLNPAQRSTLDYLARANRFSRAPSHVADYLCTTRGTASQTLKALERKGYVAPERAAGDKRSKSYSLTETGRHLINAGSKPLSALEGLSGSDAAALQRGLAALAERLLAQRGHRPFGLCRNCRFHDNTPEGARCRLLGLALTHTQADQICHEFKPSTAATG